MTRTAVGGDEPERRRPKVARNLKYRSLPVPWLPPDFQDLPPAPSGPEDGQQPEPSAD